MTEADPHCAHLDQDCTLRLRQSFIQPECLLVRRLHQALCRCRCCFSFPLLLPPLLDSLAFTLEVAYSESDSKLNSDVRFWLNPGDGNANICLTLRINRSRPEIRIEKWERQNNKAHRSQVIWVTKQRGQLNVTGHPLLIPFESLFRYQSTCPREKDLEISQQQLEKIARKIWNKQWGQQNW